MRGGRWRTAPPLLIKASNKDKTMQNKYRKTYEVVGLIEWTAVIPAGKSALVVDFTGGGLSSYGVTPATFTTDNILYQSIIENSKYYKSGKIRLGHTIKLATKNVLPVTDIEVVNTYRNGLREVPEVGNCADAKLWLKTNMDISLGAKSKKEILEIAAANGVCFPNIAQ